MMSNKASRQSKMPSLRRAMTGMTGIQVTHKSKRTKLTQQIMMVILESALSAAPAELE